ncbi:MULTISPECIES: hypothetical protein [Bacillus]|uniref:Uncharacterized protein n=1 Tax=Bacillus pumilus TaxID=1408 RepID=A0AAD0HN53_BACPU|nr:MULTISPECIES: hypothetical protein [Bacillus]AVM24326.1 hypothetical protein C5695_10950 [Bacillus pumilus]MCY7542521.1 hypothetical protein [Bacillus safensis]MCY7552396.1 hypothetical protein [Bacillus safensis]MCY7644827.1 hypothetical protein [Bacillus safensis]MCY7655858.1 hypothetical protein [Bacillus safensis]
MGKVLTMLPSLDRAKVNQAISQKHKRRSLLSQAFAELKQETGIDHRKVINGDTKEKNRLKMKQYQDALKDK